MREIFKSARLWLAGLAAAAFLVLGGCATVEPVKQADSVEQRAYAVYGTFVILEERAAQVVESPTTPASVVKAVAAADAVAKPAADALLDAVLTLVQARAAFDVGSNTVESVAAATTAVTLRLTTLSDAVYTLQTAIKEVR